VEVGDVARRARPHRRRAGRDDGEDVASLRAMKVVSIDGGDAIAITSGASSITLRKDGTIVLKGTEIVIDGPSNMRARLPQTPSTRAAKMSEIF
jgi:type VI secretion system secreted protein VgrG